MEMVQKMCKIRLSKFHDGAWDKEALFTMTLNGDVTEICKDCANDFRAVFPETKMKLVLI